MMKIESKRTTVHPAARGYVKQYGKPDVIVASSVHPLTMVAGIRIAKKFKIPCVCEIRDLWPEAIFTFGKAKPSSILGRILLTGEHWIYRKAAALIFTKEGDTDYLKERSWTTEQGGDIDLKKCHYINNGVNLKAYKEQIATDILDDSDLLDTTKFNVIYAGTVRPVNNVGNMLDCAKLIKAKAGYNDIQFLIYGDGSELTKLRQRVIDEPLDNVKLKGFVARKHMPYVLSKSSVNILNYAQNQFNWTRGNSSNKPDVVLVHGDTSTTFVTALACFYLQIPVGHVEAGLRTYNIYSPYPEEFNRQAVSIISSYNFAPTELSKSNLIKEGKKSESIYITGNTAIDALQTTVYPNYTHPELQWASDSRLILITAHRRENLGEPMHHMFRAIRRIMDEHTDIKAIYPIHMNPAVRQEAEEDLGRCDRIHIIEPLDVLDFHNFLARSYLVLTDSGGIQEEAPSLGKPVLVMRDTTERPEGIKAGTLKLVGTDEDVIYENFKELLENRESYDNMAHASNPYGDGKASIRIADILEQN